jgi:hypothetical protein
LQDTALLPLLPAAPQPNLLLTPDFTLQQRENKLHAAAGENFML